MFKVNTYKSVLLLLSWFLSFCLCCSALLTLSSPFVGMFFSYRSSHTTAFDDFDLLFMGGDSTAVHRVIILCRGFYLH